MDAMDEAKQAAPASCLLEIEYEELCRDPVMYFRRVAEFADLPWVPAFERTIRAASLRSENEKRQRDFTPNQQAILESVLRSQLVRYGYEGGITDEAVSRRVSSM